MKSIIYRETLVCTQTFNIDAYTNLFDGFELKEWSVGKDPQNKDENRPVFVGLYEPRS